MSKTPRPILALSATTVVAWRTVAASQGSAGRVMVIDFRAYRSGDRPLRLSASAVRSFTDCPYRYALEHVSRVPYEQRQTVPAMAIGTAVHAAIAAFHKKGSWETQHEDDLVNSLENYWVESAFADSTTSALELERGKMMLAAFHENEYLATVREQLGVEVFLAWDRPYRGLLAVGKIDRAVLDEDGRLIIVDYKTGSRVPTQQDLARDAQALFYRTIAARAYRQLANSSEIEIAFHYLASGKTVSVVFDEDVFRLYWMGIEAVAARIKTALLEHAMGQRLDEAFILKPGRQCEGCSVRRQCQASVSLSCRDQGLGAERDPGI